MRGFRDRDFLQTPEDFLFCVIGPFHPSDRVLAYLKYAPNAKGLWRRGTKRFERVLQAYTVPSLLETFALLKTEHPQYMFYSRFYKVEMATVPLACIKKHFKPEEKLAWILAKKDLDALQQKLYALVKYLSEISGVDTDFFGVTGSILLDMHSARFSDIDLTVYGLSRSIALKKALNEVYGSSGLTVKRFEGAALKKWCEQKVAHYPLIYADALRIYGHKWNLGVFEETPFSIHPVKLENEVKEKYGDKTYTPLGTVAVRGVVADNSESLFLPAVYLLRNVEVVEPTADMEDVRIREVVSYESLYDNMVEAGEQVKAKGKLERVEDAKTGQTYHRVLVGSPEGKGREYIKPV